MKTRCCIDENMATDKIRKGNYSPQRYKTILRTYLTSKRHNYGRRVNVEVMAKRNNTENTINNVHADETTSDFKQNEPNDQRKLQSNHK